MSDSFRFDITGAPLEVSLAVAFSLHDAAIGWRYRMLNDRYTLVLYWYNRGIDNVNPFPSPLTVKEVLPIVEKWLKEAKYEEEPDHDGCNERDGACSMMRGVVLAMSMVHSWVFNQFG